MGQIDVAFASGALEQVQALAIEIREHAQTQSLTQLENATQELVSLSSQSPADQSEIAGQIETVTNISAQLFAERFSNNSIGLSYQDAAAKLLTALQTGWTQRNFRSMFAALEKLQFESYVLGHSVIGESITPLLQSCSARNIEMLNGLLEPFLNLMHSKLTESTQPQDGPSQPQSNVDNELNSSPATAITPEPQAPPAQPQDSTPLQTPVRLTLNTDVSKFEEPVVSTLPIDEDFREIITDFVPQLESKLEEIRLTIQKGDFVELGKLGHWLKGAGGTCGFLEFYQPSLELEEAAAANDLEGCEMVFDLLLALGLRIVVPETV